MSSPCLSLSVIVASGGRPSLARTLGSIVPQLTVYDQLLALVDQRAPFGHASRNLMCRWATGEYLAFCDDDEEWGSGTVELMRSKIALFPDTAHMFAGRTIVIPRRLSLVRWGGDADGLKLFAAQVSRRATLIAHPESVVVQ